MAVRGSFAYDLTTSGPGNAWARDPACHVTFLLRLCSITITRVAYALRRAPRLRFRLTRYHDVHVTRELRVAQGNGDIEHGMAKGHGPEHIPMHLRGGQNSPVLFEFTS